MYGLQPVHELHGHYNQGLQLESGVFQALFQLFEIFSEKLHDQIVVFVVRAVRVETGKSDSSCL